MSWFGLHDHVYDRRMNSFVAAGSDPRLPAWEIQAAKGAYDTYTNLSLSPLPHVALHIMIICVPTGCSLIRCYYFTVPASLQLWRAGSDANPYCAFSGFSIDSIFIIVIEAREWLVCMWGQLRQHTDASVRAAIPTSILDEYSGMITSIRMIMLVGIIMDLSCHWTFLYSHAGVANLIEVCQWLFLSVRAITPIWWRRH